MTEGKASVGPCALLGHEGHATAKGSGQTGTPRPLTANWCSQRLNVRPHLNLSRTNQTIFSTLDTSEANRLWCGLTVH